MTKTRQPIKARVSVAGKFFTFRSLIAVRKFLTDVMLDNNDMVEKFYTLTSCVQVYNVRNVEIRVITTNGL